MMAQGWQDDKRWSDRFLPEIKRILGEHLIGEPPIEEDQERNTDLMVLKMDAVRVGCRVREHRYLQSYGHQFTVRESRPSGARTELQKVTAGWGDYFFYGFSDEDQAHLIQWALIDLCVFREWYADRLECCHPGERPGRGKSNRDESSTFRAFDIDDMRDAGGLVAACLFHPSGLF